VPQTFEQYRQEVLSDVKAAIQEKGCQPILFVGSGLSRRYFQGPSWIELLEWLALGCPAIERDFAYYKQLHDSLIDIGEEFAGHYHSWAWGKGKKEFPAELFKSEDRQVYIKHKTCEYFKSITPSSLDDPRLQPYRAEIQAIRKIHPHAIITTNYDTFTSTLFERYEPIIGQQVLRANFASVGELFKIHGCVTKLDSLVLTRRDYDEFNRKKKYLSAKLLTFFAEHPLVFLGYRAEDPNILAILSDIDEILSGHGELVPNLFFLEWMPGCESKVSLQRERVLVTEAGKMIRVRNIVADSFEWVYSAFACTPELEKVDPKMLRSILRRTYELVRCDIPNRPLEVDYEILEQAATMSGFLPSLYGISTLDDPAKFNANFPYTLTQIAKKLGFTHWSPANVLLAKIKGETGVDIKASDNCYHTAVKFGTVNENRYHKYSDKFVSLLRDVKEGKEYKIEISSPAKPKA